MKDYKVEFLDLAGDDLYDLQTYYSSTFGRRSGQKVLNKVLRAVRMLKSFSCTGTLIQDYELKLQGYRTSFAGEFVIVYRVIEKNIYIYHIADTDTNYMKFFK